MSSGDPTTVRGNPVARLIRTKKYSGLPSKLCGSFVTCCASLSPNGVPSLPHGTALTSRVPFLEPSVPTIAGYMVSVSSKYASGSVLNAAVPNLRISDVTSCFVEFRINSLASEENKTPSFHSSRTFRQSMTRECSEDTGHIVLRSVSRQLTSIAHSNACAPSLSTELLDET